MPPLGCLEVTADAPWAHGELCDVTLYLEPATTDAVADAADRLVQQRLSGEKPAYLTAEQARDLVSPAAGARESVVAALQRAGVDHVHAVGHRAVHAQGRWEDLEKVLTVSRVRFRTRDGVLLGRDGPITLTDEALGSVGAVFGIDNRRAVSSYVIISHVIISHVIISHVIISHVIISHAIKDRLVTPDATDYSALLADMDKAKSQKDRRWFTPDEIAERYGFPDGTGAGVKVAVLAFSGALGGTDQVVMGGYHEEALRRYWRGELGLSSSPTLRSAVVRGPGNWPSDGRDTGEGIDFTHEVMLDLSVVGALVPDADITVWFTEPTEQGFVDA